MTTPFLEQDIERDEGRRSNAYQDSIGVWTVGVGHAHVAPGTVWSEAMIDRQRDVDIARAKYYLNSYLPWWKNLSDERQDVLVNMCFNMGIHTLLKFKNALAAMQAGKFCLAAASMLASDWAKQVHARAIRLAEQMKTGVRA